MIKPNTPVCYNCYYYLREKKECMRDKEQKRSNDFCKRPFVPKETLRGYFDSFWQYNNIQQKRGMNNE